LREAGKKKIPPNSLLFLKFLRPWSKRPRYIERGLTLVRLQVRIDQLEHPAEVVNAHRSGCQPSGTRRRASPLTAV
jgi:hypothetical protein